jgi:hypothetical protein
MGYFYLGNHVRCIFVSLKDFKLWTWCQVLDPCQRYNKQQYPQKLKKLVVGYKCQK